MVYFVGFGVLVTVKVGVLLVFLVSNHPSDTVWCILVVLVCIDREKVGVRLVFLGSNYPSDRRWCFLVVLVCIDRKKGGVFWWFWCLTIPRIHRCVFL